MSDIPKGYKQTEVGVIPEEWDVTNVGDEFFIELGKMLDAEKNIGVSKPYLSNRAVQWGRFELNAIGVINLTPSDLHRFRLREGDLLVCEGGEVGRAAIWYQAVDECYFQKTLHRLRPKRGYNVRLMFNILNRLSSSNLLQSYVTQTSIAHLTKDKFATVPIPLPPTKAEQEAIAGALGDADALIESLDRLIAKKRGLKQAAMQELLTGKRRLPGFSGKWEVKTLGDTVEIKKGQLITENDAIPGTIPVIAGGMKPAYYHNKPNRTGKTITVSASGSAGYVAFFDEPIFASDCSTISEGCDYSVEFVYFHLLQKQASIYKMQTGGAQPHIHAVDLTPLKIYMPPLPEQIAIAEVLSDMDAEIAALEQRRDKSRALKQGMMQELLTGRIRLV